MSKKPTQENHLPPPLHNLTLKELFLFTGISLYLLEGFIQGKFKPRREDREKLTNISRRFYAWNDLEKTAFIQRKKWRTIRSFLSLSEKEELFNQPEKYSKRLDVLLEKYWHDIILANAGDKHESASEL